ncbi:MAG: cell division protein FtsA, partial [Flavobacteriaceae bacterium]|nr:cell division protein FtsA [Flavobacteriaceae bacterium]
KLIAGIVLTGGGSQLKHLKQLVEYVTGMDTRVGYPNEHLAGDTDQNVTSPLYATAVGLLMDGLGRSEKNDVDQEASSTAENFQKDENQRVETEKTEISNKTKIHKNRDSFLDKLTEKVKDFLDNAE